MEHLSSCEVKQEPVDDDFAYDAWLKKWHQTKHEEEENDDKTGIMNEEFAKTKRIKTEPADNSNGQS